MKWEGELKERINTLEWVYNARPSYQEVRHRIKELKYVLEKVDD